MTIFTALLHGRVTSTSPYTILTWTDLNTPRTPYDPENRKNRKWTYMEQLRVLQHVLSIIHQQLTSDEHNDGGICGRRGLRVEGQDAVHDFGKGEGLYC